MHGLNGGVTSSVLERENLLKISGAGAVLSTGTIRPALSSMEAIGEL
jgi:hypothetical protein